MDERAREAPMGMPEDKKAAGDELRELHYQANFLCVN
jgi:hypothetical protein